jgi:hypothetical protein
MPLLYTTTDPASPVAYECLGKSASRVGPVGLDKLGVPHRVIRLLHVQRPLKRYLLPGTGAREDRQAWHVGLEVHEP